MKSRIVVVGDENTGKTALISVMLGLPYPRIHIPTIDDTFDVPSTDIQFIDTSGSSAFDRFRPFSIQQGTEALICFSVDSLAAFDQIEEKWIPEIRYYCKNCPCTIVATKIDLRTDTATLSRLKSQDSEPISFDRGKQLADKYNFKYAECSALDFNQTQEFLKQLIERDEIPLRKLSIDQFSRSSSSIELDSIHPTDPVVATNYGSTKEWTANYGSTKEWTIGATKEFNSNLEVDYASVKRIIEENKEMATMSRHRSSISMDLNNITEAFLSTPKSGKIKDDFFNFSRNNDLRSSGLSSSDSTLLTSPKQIKTSKTTNGSPRKKKGNVWSRIFGGKNVKKQTSRERPAVNIVEFNYPPQTHAVRSVKPIQDIKVRPLSMQAPKKKGFFTRLLSK